MGRHGEPKCRIEMQSREVPMRSQKIVTSTARGPRLSDRNGDWAMRQGAAADVKGHPCSRIRGRREDNQEPIQHDIGGGHSGWKREESRGNGVASCQEAWGRTPAGR